MSESTAPLYDTDFTAWAHQQAEYLRKRSLAKLDYDHLAEEIAALAKRDRRALERHLRNLILHCLKWEYQPQERTRRGRSWQTSMDNARDTIEQLLRDNPGLQHDLQDAMAWAYPRACRTAQKQAGLSFATFPERSPWPFEQFMDEGFWR